MCGGLRLEAAAFCTAALALHAGGVVCVWWALILVWGVGIDCSPRPLDSRVLAPCAFGVCSLRAPTSLRMIMIPPPNFCTAAADVLALHDLCFNFVRFPGAGDFGVVRLAPGHFQIDCGWIGQWVSCRGVS